MSGHKNKHAIIRACHNVLTAVLLEFQVFWDVMLCHWACSSWHFKRKHPELQA